MEVPSVKKSRFWNAVCRIYPQSALNPQNNWIFSKYLGILYYYYIKKILISVNLAVTAVSPKFWISQKEIDHCLKKNYLNQGKCYGTFEQLYL